MMRLVERLLLDSMPGTCFISHDDDAQMGIVAQLQQCLPRHVKPYLFPTIKVMPDQRVSDDLVAAILRCLGLIYIISPNSQKSVWVSFERDYALRSNRRVYSFDAQARSISEDQSKPLDLRVYPYHLRRDADRIRAITAFMKERHFTLSGDTHEILLGADFGDAMTRNISTVLDGGGYFVAFLTKALLQTPYDQRELQLAIGRAPNQILPVIVDPIAEADMMPFVRQSNPVKLYSEGGDPSRIDWRPTSRLRPTAPSLCPRRPRDGTKLERPSDVVSDLGHVAAEIERIGGQIVVSPVQNIAAGVQRIRKADRRSGTLIPALGNEKRLGEIVLQFQRAFEHQHVSTMPGVRVGGPQRRYSLPHPLCDGDVFSADGGCLK
jgi:hypothetical protein